MVNMNNGAHKLVRSRQNTINNGYTLCGCRVSTASVLGCSLVIAVCIFVLAVLNSHMVISLEVGGNRATVDFAKFVNNRYTSGPANISSPAHRGSNGESNVVETNGHIYHHNKHESQVWFILFLFLFCILQNGILERELIFNFLYDNTCIL